MKRFLCVISLMALPVTLAGCNAGRSAVGGVEQLGAGLGEGALGRRCGRRAGSARLHPSRRAQPARRG